MLERSALIGFVGVSDLDRARQFYGETLGLRIADESPFALVADANGTMLRLTLVQRPVVAPYTVLGWNVVDIVSVIAQLTARGVHFTRYDGMGQDERGVWAAPGGARIAWFLDPDGNNLSLTEFAASDPDTTQTATATSADDPGHTRARSDVAPPGRA
jgi:catechol 2,3-dioxygenase-like lactoylglutathione lyase family enzyme